MTFDELRRQGFSNEIVDGVESVTRRVGESYPLFIRCAYFNDLGREVKIADLEDNMDIRRLPKLTEKDFERLNKYLLSWRILKGFEGPMYVVKNNHNIN